AANAVGAWFSARERSKSLCVRFVHEVRMCCEEIARRHEADGAIDDRKHFYMLLAHELEDFVARPAGFREVLVERYENYIELADFEPPFLINGWCPDP